MCSCEVWKLGKDGSKKPYTIVQDEEESYTSMRRETRSQRSHQERERRIPTIVHSNGERSEVQRWWRVFWCGQSGPSMPQDWCETIKNKARRRAKFLKKIKIKYRGVAPSPINSALSSITVFLILGQPKWWSPEPSVGTQRNFKGFDCRCTRCGNRHT